tara:strand:- start:2675 stop:2974 length:300 start_codon:yes stop_codon:yes gene_type:complete
MNRLVTDFYRQWLNAKYVVEQLKNDEWVFRYNSLSDKCCTAKRNDVELWVANGAWFCVIKTDPKAFGLIFRHYVWWAAARRKTKEANNKFKKPIGNYTL